MYCPTIIKDGKVISQNPNIYTKHYHCLNCGKDFTISTLPFQPKMGKQKLVKHKNMILLRVRWKPSSFFKKR